MYLVVDEPTTASAAAIAKVSLLMPSAVYVASPVAAGASDIVTFVLETVYVTVFVVVPSAVSNA